MGIKNFIKKKLDDPKAIYFSGISNLSLDKYKEAFYDFDRLTLIEPTNIDNWYHRGVCLLGLENFDSALNDFEYVIKSDWKDPAIYFYMGYIKLRLHKYEEAIIYLNKSTQSGHLSFYKAISHFLIKEYSDAVDNFTKAIVLLKNEIDFWDTQIGKIAKNEYDICSCHLGRGISYIKLHNHEAALKDFKKVSYETYYKWTFATKKWGLY